MIIHRTPYYNSSRATSVRPFGMLVLRSSLLAKCLREWVIGIGLGLGLGPGNAILLFFSLVLQNVVNFFVFVGSVVSYEYLIR